MRRCASSTAAALVWFLAGENAGDRQRVERGVSPAAVLRSSLRDLLAVWQSPSLRDALQLLFWMVLGVGASNPLLLLYVQELGAAPERAEFLAGALFSVAAGVNLVGMPLWGRFGDNSGYSGGLRRCSIVVMPSAAASKTATL